MGAGTFAIGQGFIDAGHLITGNSSNPYVEDVKQIFNFVTERLGIVNFNTSPKDGGYDPENRTATSVKDKMGVFFGQGDVTTFCQGLALKFLATCGYTNTSTVKPTAYDESPQLQRRAEQEDQELDLPPDPAADDRLHRVGPDGHRATATTPMPGTPARLHEWGSAPSRGRPPSPPAPKAAGRM